MGFCPQQTPATLADHIHLQLLGRTMLLHPCKVVPPESTITPPQTRCSSLKRDSLKSLVTMSPTLRSSSATSLLKARTATVKFHFQPGNVDLSFLRTARYETRCFVSMTCGTCAAPRPVLGAPRTLGVASSAACQLAPRHFLLLTLPGQASSCTSNVFSLNVTP